MKKENMYIYFALGIVVLMAVVTSVVMYQQNNKVEPLSSDITITTPTSQIE